MKKLKFLGILFAMCAGVFLGNTLNTESVSANPPCENLNCKWDYFGGFRCFDDGTTGKTCDDSGYPDCSTDACVPD